MRQGFDDDSRPGGRPASEASGRPGHEAPRAGAAFPHSLYQEWVQAQFEVESLGLEGPAALAVLPELEREALAAHLAGCQDCRRTREDLEALDRLLAASAVPVREGFKEQVLASLPAAGWEGRSRRAWRLPAAVAAGLAGLAVVLAGLAPETAAGGGLLGSFAVMAEALVASLLAGSGLLWASWRGLGMVVGEAMTWSAVAALGVLTVSLYGVLVSLIGRLQRTPATAAARSADAPERPGPRGGAPPEDGPRG